MQYLKVKEEPKKEAPKTENTLLKLNEYLFEQIERLNQPDLAGDELEVEMRKTDAVINVAKTIVSNAELVLKAQVAQDNMVNRSLPKLLGQ